MSSVPRFGTPWTQREDDILRKNFLFLTHSQVSKLLKRRTRNAVRNRCSLLGLLTKAQIWTPAEDLQLADMYSKQSANGTFDLNVISVAMNRTRAGIACRSNELGLTDVHRKPTFTTESKQALRDKVRNWIKECGHPRGMLGVKHSESARTKMSEFHRARAANTTREQYRERSAKMIKTNIERYGCENPSFQTTSNPYSRTKSGKRADLGGRFFRSAWEANYARYLNFLVSQKQIKSWDYEPKTFVFHGTTRGVISYTPDFYITENNGDKIWHEVKGWMDAKSKSKLKKFAKFYPEEKLIVIAQSEYKAISQYSRLIEGWE